MENDRKGCTALYDSYGSHAIDDYYSVTPEILFKSDISNGYRRGLLKLFHIHTNNTYFIAVFETNSNEIYIYLIWPWSRRAAEQAERVFQNAAV